jgi:hypothetical protein
MPGTEVMHILYAGFFFLLEQESILILIQLFCVQSVGCTVEGKHPHDVIEQINNGELEVPED